VAAHLSRLLVVSLLGLQEPKIPAAMIIKRHPAPAGRARQGSPLSVLAFLFEFVSERPRFLGLPLELSLELGRDTLGCRVLVVNLRRDVQGVRQSRKLRVGQVAVGDSFFVSLP
jgi:hypothetical protein